MLIAARPLAAQDITFLVVALVPPIVAAPFCLALARWLWVRRHPRLNLGAIKILLVSALDIILWLTFIFSAGVLMTGDFHRAALPVPPITLGGLWLLSKLWVDSSQTKIRWLHFAFPAIMLMALSIIGGWVILAFDS